MRELITLVCRITSCGTSDSSGHLRAFCPASRGVSSFRNEHPSPFPGSSFLCGHPAVSTPERHELSRGTSSALCPGPDPSSQLQHVLLPGSEGHRAIVCAERRDPAPSGKAGNSSSLRRRGGDAAVCPGCGGQVPAVPGTPLLLPSSGRGDLHPPPPWNK